jgi:hypothetical protein
VGAAGMVAVAALRTRPRNVFEKCELIVKLGRCGCTYQYGFLADIGAHIPSDSVRGVETIAVATGQPPVPLNLLYWQECILRFCVQIFLSAIE